MEQDWMYVISYKTIKETRREKTSTYGYATIYATNVSRAIELLKEREQGMIVTSIYREPITGLYT